MTNASLIADKFENTTCQGNHFHSHGDATEWSPQISDELPLGISELIVDSKRVPLAEIHHSFLANPGRAVSDMFKRHVFVCHSCDQAHGEFMGTHNRIEGECKCHAIPEAKCEPEWTCPECNWKGRNGNSIRNLPDMPRTVMMTRAGCQRAFLETRSDTQEPHRSQPAMTQQEMHQRAIYLK